MKAMNSSRLSNFDDESFRGRRNIRDIKTFGELSNATKAAYWDEENRKTRQANHEKELLSLFPNGEAHSQLILDFDPETKKPSVVVDKQLLSLLKTHQKEGIRFMWNACVESVDEAKKNTGTGCILAHCMGLGKTLQVITLINTITNCPALNLKSFLILCPKNTVLNWVNEFEKWIKPPLNRIKVYNPTRCQKSRISDLLAWRKTGGVCVLNYSAFRILLEKYRMARDDRSKDVVAALINPGADVVVCDEGHILKNENTRLAKEMMEIKSLRRIILTGTPLQNNLIEYFCMVNFVRPGLLGTKSEFKNMFANPIQNGQYDDSNDRDVSIMKGRAHVLHRTLTTCIQRYDHTTLAEFLPKKHEFVLNLPLTSSQLDLYQKYLDKITLGSSWQVLVKGLFADYQLLQRVWTHPYSLKIYDARPAPVQKKKADSDDEDIIQRPSRWMPGWWEDSVQAEDVYKIDSSAKLTVLFQIIKYCIRNNEKLLVFSGSLISLEMIEYFLTRAWDDGSPAWQYGQDYFMINGSTSGPDRDDMCQKFNDPKNKRTRLFLISTKAGGVGITLNAANRAVIFDASWNPSHDIQSIFRIYRLGQTKPCYVYRLISSGTMEEKIYERQVAKQSTSRRVVDEKQIQRHYSMQELRELYELEANKIYKNNPHIANQDLLLTSLVCRYPNLIKGYHEHDSLLKHKINEELRDYEKNEAWMEFSDGTKDGLSKCRETANKLCIPDNLNKSNFKTVFQQKYSLLPANVIDGMIDELMPRINDILHKPNFKELMFQEALKNRKEEELVKKKNTFAFTKKTKSMIRSLHSWGVRGGIPFGDPDSE